MCVVGYIVNAFNETICAGNTVNCNCTTSTGTVEWNISKRALGFSEQIWEPVTKVNFDKFTPNFENIYGYNFTFNQNLNISGLTFNLNSSEDVLIVCASRNKEDNKGAVITNSMNTPVINYFQVGSTIETCMCYVLVVFI